MMPKPATFIGCVLTLLLAVTNDCPAQDSEKKTKLQQKVNRRKEPTGRSRRNPENTHQEN